jgi:transcriptional regulator with XRE-family HTH domain
MKTTDPSNIRESSTDCSARIRAERLKRALSQEALAEKAGLSARTIQRAECGETPAPDTLRALAAALDILVEELEAKAPRKVFRAFSRTSWGWAPYVALLSVIVLVLFLTPPFGSKEVLYFITACYLFNLPWLVTGFSLKDGRLLVHHVGWAKEYDLGKATGAARCTQARIGPLQVFSYFFSISGMYYNKLLGFYRGYVTDFEKAVLVEFGKRKIVVTPDDPEEFLASLKDEVSANFPDRELGVPRCIPSASGSGAAEKLRAKRIQLGLTQEDLAAKAGVNVRTIQRIENGAVPARGTLLLLAQALGAELSDLAETVLRTDFKAPWNKSAKIVGAAALVIIIAIPFLTVFRILPDWFNVPLVVLTNVIAMNLFVFNEFLSVTGYGIRDGRLFVLHLGFASKYDLSRLTRIEANPDAMMGAIPLTFPLLLLSPWCKSPFLGVFRAFVTDEKNCVILSFGKKTIVVTPDDPAAFVETLRAELRKMGESAPGNRA